MDDARDDSGSDQTLGSEAEEDGQTMSDALELAATTLVEVSPGVAVVFGEVPDGLELTSLDIIPSFDRAQLSTALSPLGNAGTIVGNVAETASNARGLFRLADTSQSILESGGTMAAKDGAKLGAIFKNGKIVGQARFVPVSMSSAAAIAAIGPAVAMIALQMQLGEISGLVRSNIQLTTQTLKAIRYEQWAELEGLAESVDEAVKEARELDVITESVWDPIAPSGPNIRKQLKLYRKNVADHVNKIGGLEARARREYLESNAEAIVFDTYALLSSLKTYGEYQAIRAALARARGSDDESEAQLYDRITRSIPDEINDSLSEIRTLTDSLVRQLRIIAELPGRATVPLTKKRKNAKASELTCTQLLEAIGPLNDKLRPTVDAPQIPGSVCAPEGLELEPYLHILRWFLEDGETLRSVAFPFEAEAHNLAGAVPAILARRVDSAWSALTARRSAAVVEKFASSTFVAVTDRRIITANPGSLLRHGKFGSTYSLDEVRNVRVRSRNHGGVRTTIDVATEDCDLHWMFPNSAAHEDVDSFASALSEGKQPTIPDTPAIE